jgi:hypothetical protein
MDFSARFAEYGPFRCELLRIFDMPSYAFRFNENDRERYAMLANMLVSLADYICFGLSFIFDCRRGKILLCQIPEAIFTNHWPARIGSTRASPSERASPSLTGNYFEHHQIFHS